MNCFFDDIGTSFSYKIILVLVFQVISFLLCTDKIIYLTAPRFLDQTNNCWWSFFIAQLLNKSSCFNLRKAPYDYNKELLGRFNMMKPRRMKN